MNLRHFTEIEDNKPKFTIFEEKTIDIVESRGIASYDNRQIIEEIIDIINQYIEIYSSYVNWYKEIYNDYKGKHNVKVSDYIQIKIPKEITNKFKEFENLELIIYVKNIIGNINPYNHITDSLGKNELVLNNEINNNKLKLAKITIYCTAINNKIVKSDFYEAFTHEFNHAYEEYKRKLSNINNNNVKDSLTNFKHLNLKQRQKLLISKNEVESSFGWILYSLWAKNEFNAWVTSSYSYLKGIDSKRENFYFDIKNCEAYELYQNIKNKFLPVIKKCEDITMWIHVNNIISYNKMSIDDINEKSLEKIKKFKKRFINKTEKIIDRFWIRLCRNASLWYDEKEKINN